MCDQHVTTYLEADREQQRLIAEVARLGDVKRDVVLALRADGLTFAEIGGLVGLSVPGVQRIAGKAKGTK